MIEGCVIHIHVISFHLVNTRCSSNKNTTLECIIIKIRTTNASLFPVKKNVRTPLNGIMSRVLKLPFFKHSYFFGKIGQTFLRKGVKGFEKERMTWREKRLRDRGIETRKRKRESMRKIK